MSHPHKWETQLSGKTFCTICQVEWSDTNDQGRKGDANYTQDDIDDARRDDIRAEPDVGLAKLDAPPREIFAYYLCGQFIGSGTIHNLTGFDVIEKVQFIEHSAYLALKGELAEHKQASENLSDECAALHKKLGAAKTLDALLSENGEVLALHDRVNYLSVFNFVE